MTSIAFVCPKCGIIAKSGKNSCCGRSGSWFGNCGSAGNVKLDHTWYEGIQVCRTLAHSKTAIGRQSNAGQQRDSFDGPGMTVITMIATTTTTVIIMTPTIITHTVKEAVIITDWISQGL